IYIAVAVVCAVLVVLVIAVIYLIRVRQRKGKSSPSVRLHEPKKSPSTALQDSDPNTLTYADLNFDKQKKKKSTRRFMEMSPQSEYACIQTGQPAVAEDNLTYADLDMVHLSKAPKRPAPRPEEAISEYASVQIQKK
ncbi:Tyrosine-protein phosphatase non-receptor type substrate 1, partial [Chelonia mydas]